MKKRITITVDQKILNILDKKVDAKVYGSRSHGLEVLIKERMQHES
ncbi:hypothetical protein J4464_00695 [Candidatus Woesearchaeota archaeon]|nr:hypothetical protein [Candidatus Woesearchaeota archaeon]